MRNLSIIRLFYLMAQVNLWAAKYTIEFIKGGDFIGLRHF